MSSTSTLTVLITGCSEGSLGSALALAFHKHKTNTTEYQVFATARDLSKTNHLQTQGIQCLALDVLSESSIQTCVSQISTITNGTLDILINNAGGGHYMPFLHLDLTKAKALFDTNVWSYLSVTQAFLPLLLKNKSPGGKHSLLVNNTSISSVLRTPYHSAYGASKAAMAAFNDAQRIELAPLGVKVVDLKTGSTESNFARNRTNELVIPEDSPYQLIRDEVMNVITGDATEAYAESQEDWAENVVRDLSGRDPPATIWRGGKAGTVKVSGIVEQFLPTGMGDKQFQQLGGLDKLEKIMREKEAERQKGKE